MSGECDSCGEHCLECRCSKWISVKVQIPKDSRVDRYLVIDKQGSMHVAHVAYRCFGYEDCCDRCADFIDDVTHWMPLPEPPTCLKSPE